MLTVAILINGNPLMARSARRVKTNPNRIHVYKCDDGKYIHHAEDDGAVVLAKKLLDTIKE